MNRFSSRQYAEVLYELVEKASKNESKDIIKKFVAVLVKNGDMSKISLITQEFEKIHLSKIGKEKIEVTTTGEDGSKLKSELKGEVTLKEDARILGGVRIKIGDKLIDNTLRARVNRLKGSLEI
jgi:F-type H+-transporting ATPase subunit delta